MDTTIKLQYICSTKHKSYEKALRPDPPYYFHSFYCWAFNQFVMKNYKTIIFDNSKSIPDPWNGSMVKTGNQVQGYTEVSRLWKNDMGVIPYHIARIYLHSN